MSPVHLRGLGIEDLVDLVVVTLEDKLNARLESEAALRAPKDQERAERRNVDYVPIELEPVSPTAFHVGSLPSLVSDDLPLDDYPYVAVTFDDATPDPEDASEDHRNVYRDMLMVHSVAKASLRDGAEVCWRRAARMAESAHAVVMGDSSLAGMLRGASNPMRALMSEPFKFSPSGIEGADHEWFWVSAGAMYVVKNYTFPEEV